MPKKLLCFLCCLVGFLNMFSSSLFAVADIPGDLFNDFTMNGQIPVSYRAQNNRNSALVFYSSEFIQSSKHKALLRIKGYFGETDAHLYRALNDMALSIKDRKVAIIGSCDGWYESIMLAYGALPVVIDSRSIRTGDSTLTYITPEAFSNDPQKFDLVISLKNVAHDGLGCNGDVIDPDGDLKSMARYKNMLNENGKLILAIPVGPDQLVWNDHRVYGEKRLKLLLKGWKTVRYYGFTSEHVFQGINYRPVFLLQSK